MTTRVTVDFDDTTVTMHATDDTGRDDTAVMPRYPRPGSDLYLKWADTLDMIMAGDWEPVPLDSVLE